MTFRSYVRLARLWILINKIPPGALLLVIKICYFKKCAYSLKDL